MSSATSLSSATSRVNVLCPSCYLRVNASVFCYLLLLLESECLVPLLLLAIAIAAALVLFLLQRCACAHKLIRSSSLHPNDLRREGIMWSDERCKCARVCVCVWKTKDENETRKMKTKDERRKTKDENENRRRKPTNTPPNRQLVTADYAELSNSLLY